MDLVNVFLAGKKIAFNGFIALDFYWHTHFYYANLKILKMIFAHVNSA